MANLLKVNTALHLSRATANNLNLNKLKVSMAQLRDITVNPNPVSPVNLVVKDNTDLSPRLDHHMAHL
jgi:hypothetical protein